jgi:hypothetical protein
MASFVGSLFQEAAVRPASEMGLVGKLVVVRADLAHGSQQLQQ